MVKLIKVKARGLSENVNLAVGKKYYFGTSPHRRISVYFKNKRRMLKFYNILIKRQRTRDKYLTPIEKQKQYLYVLTM